MPKTTTLVPLTHPDTGEALASGVEIDLSDEAYAHLRSQGQVAASEQEVKEHVVEGTEQGVYDARITREDVASTQAEEPKQAEPREEKKK